ncbi:MAG: ATP-binding protein [Bacilli bacterium]|nr:ATP-binding protein [Bacilli bacterium]
MNEIGKVFESTGSIIKIKLNSIDEFEQNKNAIKIGKYLAVQEGNLNYILVTILNIKTIEGQKDIEYHIETQPIGSYFQNDGNIDFKQGSVNIPSPTEPVFIPDNETIDKIFAKSKDFAYRMGKLSNNDSIDYYINGNAFFSKHIGIVGSTGSGKSCSVAKIIQQVAGIDNALNINKGSQKNSHIIIFDIHSEYKNAFSLDESENFTLNNLDVEKINIPYWLMNSEELESLFIESNEMNSHNQISQFKRAVILSKEKHNPGRKITYDMPVYFDIKEVYNFIYNLNCEVISKIDGESGKPKLKDGRLIEDITEYLNSTYDFVPSSTAAATKASNGPFNGEFERFLTRIETKLNDKRLDFITTPKKDDGSEFKTEDFSIILKQFIGYIDKANISIIDLSGVPFEVLSITVSLVARLIFDFAFHYSKNKHQNNEQNDIPFMIVCEEAHNYIPKDGGAEYNASRKSIERIAKEGRKYGLSLMVVSQRPSEVSETIFSQCNNFVVLRLTNFNDQNCVKRLLPDNNSSLVDCLPTLSSGEALIVGEATTIPAIVKIDLPNPKPKSDNVDFYSEWNKDWVDLDLLETIKRWRNE